MSTLSAIGSITVPTTVWRFHRRAIHPSRRSVTPAYASSPAAQACESCKTKYPINGAATSLENVRMFGNVYMSSCRVGSDKGFDAFVTSDFCPELVRIWLSLLASVGGCDFGDTGDLELCFDAGQQKKFSCLQRPRLETRVSPRQSRMHTYEVSRHSFGAMRPVLGRITGRGRKDSDRAGQASREGGRERSVLRKAAQPRAPAFCEGSIIMAAIATTAAPPPALV